MIRIHPRENPTKPSRRDMTSRKQPRALPLLVAAAILTSASLAAAQYAPTVDDIYVEPENPNHILLRSDDWGPLQTTDGGKSWISICAEAYGGASLDTEHRDMAVLPGGAVLVASEFNGLQIDATGTLCDFQQVAAFGDANVRDVVPGPSSAIFVITAKGSGGANNTITTKVWVSHDDAQTWSMLGALPAGYNGQSVRAAPSDETRLYASGYGLGDSSVTPKIARSDDSGATWEVHDVPLMQTDATPTLRLAGVDPKNPDAVFLLEDYEPHQSMSVDRLWMSTDGAKTWTSVFTAAGNLPGFAFSPDGSRVAISGPGDGLQVARVAILEQGGGAAFSQTYDGSVWALAWTDRGLLAGTGDASGSAELQAILSISTDDGKSFDRVMTACHVTVSECPMDSTTGQRCGPVSDSPRNPWPQARERCEQQQSDAGAKPEGGAPPKHAARDAAADAAPAAIENDAEKNAIGDSSSGGCGCVVGTRRSPRLPGVFVGLLGLLAIGGWRRRAR